MSLSALFLIIFFVSLGYPFMAVEKEKYKPSIQVSVVICVISLMAFSLADYKESQAELSAVIKQIEINGLIGPQYK